MSETTMTNDDFEEIFALAVKKSFEDMVAALPSREELIKMYPVSERHVSRMKKMFRLVRRLDKIKVTLRWTRRIAISTAVVLAVFFSVLLTFSPAVRATVRNTIAAWFDGFTKFFQNDNNGTDIEQKDWRPQYLPDGYYEITVFELGDMTQIIYENTDGNIILFAYGLYEARSISTDNEDIDEYVLTVDGVDYYIFEAVATYKTNTIVWHQGGYLFDVISEIPIDDLQLIAFSVVPAY